jgi:acetyl-CoA carboxylase biotin carboxylase subunit
VEQEAELHGAWRDASSETLNAFGDSRLYLEKYLSRPRHIEIQILADTHGNTIYLGERECSVQRRYQKVIEEAPSPVMTQELRRAMGEAAVKLARAGGYVSAGTCEFLVDEAKNFYFLEMNTRLQVEHPVTEMVTALDLVKLQIRVAAGERLPLAQSEVTLRGHAIECRIYAEDPENNFFPSPGAIKSFAAPSGPGIRLDEGAYPGWIVPSDYDPMLAKLIAWGTDRNEAIARLARALGETQVGGIRTNINFFRRILADDDFVRANVHTTWLDDFIERDKDAARDEADPAAEDAAAIALALWHSARNGGAPPASTGAGSDSRWKREGRREQIERLTRR